MPHDLTPIQQSALWRKKRKIEMLLPLVSKQRRQRMAEELAKINEILGEPHGVDPATLMVEPSASSGVDGVGGLMFQTQSPPGLGRLIRLPFYLTQILNPDSLIIGSVVTDGGTDVPALANPTVIARLAFGERSVSGLLFQTPQIEWADLRVVGFQASQYWFQPKLKVEDPAGWVVSLRPFLLVKNLYIGGGANLFSQEGYVDAAVYTQMAPEFAGLREYPLLTSPSVANVQAAISGSCMDSVVLANRPSITFSLNLVCEVLDDSTHGRHIPGPYARRDAMLRTPPRTGGYPRKA